MLSNGGVTDQIELMGRLADHATTCLAMTAAAHARERKLIGMVQDRDRLIEELRHRISMLALPNGWEGSD